MTKTIKVAALLTITTGISMVDGFEGVSEAFEWVLGYPVWTHELPSAMAPASKLILEQFPDIPTEANSTNFQQVLADAKAIYGEEVEVQEGNGQRTTDPVSTLVSILS